MDRPQCRITVLHRIHNNPDSEQVVNLIQCLILVFHFFVDTEKVLDPAVDFSLYPHIADMLAHFIHNGLDISFPDTFADGNFVHQVIIHFRFQIFQRQIVQFNLDPGNAQPLCDRRINIHCLPCNALLFLRRPMF